MQRIYEWQVGRTLTSIILCATTMVTGCKANSGDNELNRSSVAIVPYDVPPSMDDRTVCGFAVSSANPQAMESRAYYQPYVVEARRRGLSPTSCDAVRLGDLSNSASAASPTQKTPAAGSSEIVLIKEGGTFKVPVLINGIIPLHFTVDSGAADVSIPADVVLTMMRMGKVLPSDFLGRQTYRLADGSTVPSQTFMIRSLQVGSHIIENVRGSMASVEGSLLLGQSFLGRFKRWSINNKNQTLELE